MRQFIDGNGNDATAAALAYREANNQYRTADLVLIGELEDPYAVRLTNWPSPLLWGPWSSATGSTPGPFLNAVISRGKITSQIGLQVDTMEFTWSPPLTAYGSSLAGANQYQKAQSGFYDQKKFRMWRTLMPAAGDANTYGACEMFGGRIQDTEVSRGKITFHVNSFLDVVNQPVPPNVIEWTNTNANYIGNLPVVSDSETTLPQFTVVSPSSAINILAQCTSPTLNKIYADNKFQFGFIAFNRGSTLDGYWSPVAISTRLKVSGVTYNQFILYAPFPWAPTPGDTFYASIKAPVNASESTPGFLYDGFRWVPQPEGAV